MIRLVRVSFLFLSVFCNQNLFAETIFKQSDDSAVTQICITAAQEGLHEAEAMFKEEKFINVSNISSIRCNGMDIQKFAAKYKKHTHHKTLTIRPADDSVVSKFCAELLKSSEQYARHKYDLQNSEISCNGKTLSEFLASAKEQENSIQTAYVSAD